MIKNIKTDDFITKTILDNTSLFENIHPNIVTISGGLLTFPIVNAIKQKEFNKMIILFFLRWLADCLDGGIARKYNKSTKLGERLDTVSDTIFTLTCAYYLTKIYNMDIEYFYSFIVILFVILYRNDMFNSDDVVDTHAKMKDYNGSNIFDNLLRIHFNNTWVLMALFLLLYRMQIKKIKLH